MSEEEEEEEVRDDSCKIYLLWYDARRDCVVHGCTSVVT